MAAALIQQAVAVSSSATSLPVTLPAAPTAGHTLVLICQTRVSGSVTTVSGGTGTWLRVLDVTTPNSGHCQIFVSGPLASGASATATPTAGGAGLTYCHLSEWSDLSALLLDSSWQYNSVSTGLAPGTVHLADAGGLVLASAAWGSGATVSSGPTGGFTALTGGASATSLTAAAAYLLPGVAGNYATSWLKSDANGNGVAGIVALASATYAGTSPPGAPTLAAEQDWAGATWFQQPATYYVVTLSTVPATQPSTIEPWGTDYGHAASVAVLGPSGALREWRRLDASRVEIWPRQAPATSLWINARPGYAGHVQAYR